MRTRFIWDELLSHRVASALRVLGFRTTYVGNEEDHGVPPRGSGDLTVVDFAMTTNQVIVTSNHDMIILCDQLGQRFVWVDPRGKRLELEQQVILAFGQIRQWDEILGSGLCVRALRTKANPIPSKEAARLVALRYRTLRRRKRAAQSRRTDEAQQSLPVDVDRSVS